MRFSNAFSRAELSKLEALLDEIPQRLRPTTSRNAARHQQPKTQRGQVAQGHFDPFQGQVSQGRGPWEHGWRIARNRRVDPNCWEVRRRINGRYTQYIQLDFLASEVRIFVHDLRTFHSIPGSFVRLTMGSCGQLRAMAEHNPAQLQELVLSEFSGHFRV